VPRKFSQEFFCNAVSNPRGPNDPLTDQNGGWQIKLNFTAEIAPFRGYKCSAISTVL